jgi:DNA uptake protein ComE-like DNA-binding protein
MTRTQELWKKSWTAGLVALAITLCVAWLASCNNKAPQSDQQLRQDAAKTTEQVKQEAQQAAADAKVAAANAERKVNDIAAGVKQGLNSNAKPSPGAPEGTVDINAADATQLESLPGIGRTRAQRIIDNRPYSSPHDLVSKGIVSEAEYSRISGRVVAD